MHRGIGRMNMKKRLEKQTKKTKKLAELAHFKRNNLLRIIREASKQGLGVVLQECEVNKWKPILYASRFSTVF